MNVNEKTTLGNLISIGLVQAATTISVGFYNSNLPFLMSSPDYLGITDSEELTAVNSTIITYSLIISTCLAIFMGIIYDYYGRRVTINTNMTVMVLTLFFLPYMATSYGMIVLNRIIFSTVTHFLYSTPLVPDYLKPDSRGKAVSNLQSIGYFAGEFFATVVIMSLTTMGDGWDYRLSFGFTAGIVLLITIFCYFNIREPDYTDNEEKDANQVVEHDKKSVCEMLKLCWTESLTDIKYFYCYMAYSSIATMPLLLTVYMVTWLKSFADQGILDNNGEPYTEKHAKNVFSKIILFVGLFTIPLLPIVGWFADKVSGHITVPLSFFLRGSIFVVFLTTVDNPESFWTCIVCTFMVTFTFVERVNLEKMF
jgi:MFS family permease